MAQIDVVKHDQGGVNARILARENKADFRRIEAASLKIPVRFASPDGKRSFVRYFNTFQLGSHFVSVIARTRLDHAEVAKAEAALRAQMDKVAEDLNQAIDAAEALFQAHGITAAATYDTVPMVMEVGVLSSSGRRYLEILGKLDQLMPLLQTLEIHEVATPEAIDRERAALKRRVRELASSARSLAGRLRRQMNALDARGAEVSNTAASSEESPEPPAAAPVPTESAAGAAVQSLAAARP
jgi:hypothetical protein